MKMDFKPVTDVTDVTIAPRAASSVTSVTSVTRVYGQSHILFMSKTFPKVLRKPFCLKAVTGATLKSEKT